MALDTSAYERSRRSINTSFNQSTAANELGRTVSQQRGARQQGDQARSFRNGWAPQASRWGNRGHTGAGVKSGFYQQAMQDYVGGYQRQRSSTLQDLANEQNSYAMNQSNLTAQKDQALAELELDKQKQIALLAQNMQAIKPSYGGY